MGRLDGAEVGCPGRRVGPEGRGGSLQRCCFDSFLWQKMKMLAFFYELYGLTGLVLMEGVLHPRSSSSHPHNQGSRNRNRNPVDNQTLDMWVR